MPGLGGQVCVDLEFPALLGPTESSGLGMPRCCDLHTALRGCHLGGPAPEDSLQTGRVVGCTQKTHLIYTLRPFIPS